MTPSDREGWPIARPQAEAALGFFAFPEPCLPLLASHFEPPEDPGACYLLDPCAGEGVAASYLAKSLDLPESNAYAVELSESRSCIVRRSYPNMRLLGPASFLGTGISYNAFSLLYVNPPYSSEMGGGRREELSFFVRAVNHGAPGAVVALVVPESVVFDWGQGPPALRRSISCRLTDVAVFRLPDAHRLYKEIVILGRKRKAPSPEGDGLLCDRDRRWWETRESLPVLGDVGKRYRLPPGKAPKRWEQTEFTEEGLKREVAKSPLASRLGSPKPSGLATPPLPPGKGHTALILASGHLDGLVWPQGEPPHVVRGTSRKVSYRDAAKCESRQNEDGSTSEKEVYSEKITLVVRAVDVGGKIHTFTDTTEATRDEPPPEGPAAD